MTKKQKKLLKKLQAEHGAKFDQICELVRKRLGYRKLSKLSDEERRQVVEEAEELTENWDRAVVEDRELQAKTKLQKLLAEHHEIGERLLTLHQSAALRDAGRIDDDEGPDFE
jgi:hypothetical protein